MVEFPNDVMVHGFSYADVLSDIDMRDMNLNLISRDVLTENVIFSTWEDIETPCIWVVAATRYLENIEVKNVIEFILENSLEEEYLLTEIER